MSTLNEIEAGERADLADKRYFDTMALIERIEIGDTVEVTLPGVREWKIPTQVRTATVTAENIELLKADIIEQVIRGGALIDLL